MTHDIDRKKQTIKTLKGRVAHLETEAEKTSNELKEANGKFFNLASQFSEMKRNFILIFQKVKDLLAIWSCESKYLDEWFVTNVVIVLNNFENFKFGK